MNKIKVLIVDDEKLIRSGLKIILSSYEDIDIVGDVGDGYEALDFCRANDVDLVLMDIRMKICSGVLGTKIIKEYDNSINILILTTFNDDDYIKDAINFGASGYLLKDSAEDTIYEGIKSAHLGNIVLAKNVAEKVISTKKTVSNIDVIKKFDLTEKDIILIELIANGLSNKEISETIYLSEGTIKNNISSLLSKLNLRDRTQLAIFAYRNNMII